MKNYISINGQKIELSDDQIDKIKGSFELPDVKLADIPVGETFKIGSREFVVLEQVGDTSAVILKGLLPDQTFGSNNNFNGSNVDKRCNQFASELAAIIGDDNIIEHTVDLTSDDGMKDYGTIQRRCSLITADLYRRYVEILDKVNPGAWWWLATAHSTKRHDNDSWAKCVSPSGCIFSNFYDDSSTTAAFARFVFLNLLSLNLPRHNHGRE